MLKHLSPIGIGSVTGETSDAGYELDSAMSGRGIEVSEFSASSDRVRGNQNRRSARNWSRVIGLVGTLCLHGLALQSALLGSGNHRPHPPVLQGAGAARIDPAALPAEELVLVMIADVQKDDAGLAEQIASLGPQLKNLSIPIMIADPSAELAIGMTDNAPDGSTQVAPEAGDPAVRALMFGRYTGQISARIERAWRRPRSPVTDAPVAPPRDSQTVNAADSETFTCRVQIRQDSRGNVQEVLLIRCNGTEAWRHSLVVAIDQASPLPAPPIPSVFARAVTMTFEAHAYRPGDPAYAYQTVARSGDDAD